MNTIEALDKVFDFLPKDILVKLKREGLYVPILSGSIATGAELYDYLSDEHAAFQDANYTELASEMAPWLNKGSVLQIGCGRGDLLLRLSRLGFGPVYGVDRGDVMLRKARERLAESPAYFFNSLAEDFDFSILKHIDNVIMNNFWGMMSVENSVKLLIRLRAYLHDKSVVLIGACPEDEADEKRLKAEQVLKESLNFVLKYPFFTDFSRCGYSSKLIDLGGAKYYLLSL